MPFVFLSFWLSNTNVQQCEGPSDQCNQCDIVYCQKRQIGQNDFDSNKYCEEQHSIKYRGTFYCVWLCTIVSSGNFAFVVMRKRYEESAPKIKIWTR